LIKFHLKPKAKFVSPKKTTGTTPMSILSDMLAANRFTPEDVPRFEAKLFFEGARRRRYYEQFGVLLVLATVIATTGILGDSTATVIGAMIIAPLMTPIMATAAALITGRMGRAGRSLLLVAIGVLSVIGVAWLFGTLYTGVISFDSNAQILGRISPRVIDLIAALASGAAGAFCMAREDISDSLPGVAISISLVPPLCVVGISLQAGQWDAAGGAFLLFLTNFLSILLAGGGVLALLGLSGAAMVKITGPARRNAFLVIFASVVLVTVPLWITSMRISEEARTEGVTKAVALRWAAGTGYEVRSVNAHGDDITVLITGFGTLPVFDNLESELRAALQRPVIVILDVVPAEKFVSP
jgi:uncharacterized hydrophobic protein (TIGR00271 family)